MRGALLLCALEVNLQTPPGLEAGPVLIFPTASLLCLKLADAASRICSTIALRVEPLQLLRFALRPLAGVSDATEPGSLASR